MVPETLTLPLALPASTGKASSTEALVAWARMRTMGIGMAASAWPTLISRIE